MSLNNDNTAIDSFGFQPTPGIYLDWAAASPPLLDSLNCGMEMALDCFYNPAAVYQPAQLAKQKIYQARQELANLLQVSQNSLIFTAGATEANNLIINGFRQANRCQAAGLLADHPSLTANADQLLSIDVKTGYIDLNQLVNLDPSVGLLSLAGVNSQSGVIQPFTKIRRFVTALNQRRQKPLLIHVDASQMGFGLQLSPQSIKADLVTYSPAKIGGLKQSGFFYCRSGLKIEPTLVGGGSGGQVATGDRINSSDI